MQDYLDFTIDNFGNLSFQRPMDRIDHEIIEIIKEVIGNESEFNSLNIFLEEAGVLADLRKDHPCIVESDCTWCG